MKRVPPVYGATSLTSRDTGVGVTPIRRKMDMETGPKREKPAAEIFPEEGQWIAHQRPSRRLLKMQILRPHSKMDFAILEYVAQKRVFFPSILSDSHNQASL